MLMKQTIRKALEKNILNESDENPLSACELFSTLFGVILVLEKKETEKVDLQTLDGQKNF